MSESITRSTRCHIGHNRVDGHRHPTLYRIESDETTRGQSESDGIDQDEPDATAGSKEGYTIDEERFEDIG